MKVTLKILFTVFFGLTALLLSVQPIYAADYTQRLTKEVTILSGTEAQVTETEKITWDDRTTYFPASKNFQYFMISAPFINQDSLVESSVKDIHVTDQSGKALSFEKKMEDGALEIKVPFYKDLTSRSPLTFVLTYKTSLLTQKEGGVLEILHNAISKDFQVRRRSKSGGYDDVNYMDYVFIIPKSLGVPDFYTPATGKVQSDSQNTKISFTQGDLIEKMVRISVGKKRMIKFTLKANVLKTNDKANPLFKQIVNNQIELALPSDYDVTGQKIYYSTISPYPTKVALDENGNLIATIPINATENGVVTIEGYTEITRQTITKDSLYKWTFADIPENMKMYTAPSVQYWPSEDPTISASAAKLKDPSGSILRTVDNAVRFVTDTLEYKKVSSASELKRLGALGALENKTGVCMEYSDLLLTLLRNLGIPTRNVYGDGVGSLIDNSLDGIGHQWIEVWLPEKGWIPVDPTWSENGYIVEGPDLDHFVWYKTSESPLEPMGFDCSTWDQSYPCQESMTINTESVEALPDVSQLESTDQLIDTIAKKQQSSWTNFPVVSPVVDFLGNSSLGRFFVNGATVNIFLIVVSYFVLVLIVRWIVKMYRKRNQKSELKS